MMMKSEVDAAVTADNSDDHDDGVYDDDDDVDDDDEDNVYAAVAADTDTDGGGGGGGDGSTLTGMGIIRKDADLSNEEKQYLLTVERGDMPSS